MRRLLDFGRGPENMGSNPGSIDKIYSVKKDFINSVERLKCLV